MPPERSSTEKRGESSLYGLVTHLRTRLHTRFSRGDKKNFCAQFSLRGALLFFLLRRFRLSPRSAGSGSLSFSLSLPRISEHRQRGFLGRCICVPAASLFPTAGPAARAPRGRRPSPPPRSASPLLSSPPCGIRAEKTRVRVHLRRQTRQSRDQRKRREPRYRGLWLPRTTL